MRERAERGEGRHRRVADHLVAEREQRGHDDRGAGPPGAARPVPRRGGAATPSRSQAVPRPAPLTGAVGAADRRADPRPVGRRAAGAPAPGTASDASASMPPPAAIARHHHGNGAR